MKKLGEKKLDRVFFCLKNWTFSKNIITFEQVYEKNV
jgi:hypothetical protein